MPRAKAATTDETPRIDSASSQIGPSERTRRVADNSKTVADRRPSAMSYQTIKSVEYEYETDRILQPFGVALRTDSPSH